MATGMSTSDTFYTLSTSSSTPRTLTIHFEEIHQPCNVVVKSETHSITIGPDGTTATIKLTSDGVSASEEVLLVESGVVCIDFIPKVFGSVLAMYTVSADRMAVFMLPFAADVDPLDRVVVRFEEGMFEDVSGGRRKINTTSEGEMVSEDGKSGVGVFYAALERLFGSGKSVRWAADRIWSSRGRKKE
jgi:uncharacterized membrane protein